MSKHWQEILKELQSEIHRDGYFARKSDLEKIVDELVAEMEYANLIPKAQS